MAAVLVAAELGIRVLSRDVGADPLDLSDDVGVVELPVAVDWARLRGGYRRTDGATPAPMPAADHARLDRALAEAFAAPVPTGPTASMWSGAECGHLDRPGRATVGIMLHHEVMSDDDLVVLDHLLELLLATPAVQLRSMMACVGTP